MVKVSALLKINKIQRKVKIIGFNRERGEGERGGNLTDCFGMIHMQKNGEKFTVDLFLREFGPSLTGKSEEADFKKYEARRKT